MGYMLLDCWIMTQFMGFLYVFITINIQIIGWCQMQNSYKKRGFGCADPLLPRRWSNDYPLRMGPIFGAEFSAHKTNEFKTLSNLIGLPCCVIVMSLYQKLFYSLRVAVRCTLAHHLSAYSSAEKKPTSHTYTPLRNLDLGCGPNYQRQMLLLHRAHVVGILVVVRSAWIRCKKKVSAPNGARVQHGFASFLTHHRKSLWWKPENITWSSLRPKPEDVHSRGTAHVALSKNGLALNPS